MMERTFYTLYCDDVFQLIYMFLSSAKIKKVPIIHRDPFIIYYTLRYSGPASFLKKKK